VRNRDAFPFVPWEEQRLAVLSWAAMGVLFVLVFRLFVLQVVQGGAFEKQAKINSTNVLPLLAPRGIVFGKNGDDDVVLMDNVPRFSLFYSHQEGADSESLENELGRLLPKDAKRIRKKIARARYSGKMIRLVTNIPPTLAMTLMERRFFYRGVDVLAEPQRRDRLGRSACHWLGYVDEVDDADLRAGGVKSGQMVGKAGLEKSFDRWLRGTDGGLQLETDSVGRHVQVLRQIPSVPGADVYATLDERVQRAAEEGLAHSPSGRGAAVALDPRTGAVLALVSAPSFDPAENMGAYLEDPALPLFNRALRGAYPPGSLFKIVTAVAGFQEGGWDTKTSWTCNGSFPYGARVFKCWKKEGHGRLDFWGAVAWSCNVYFFQMGLKVGPASLESWARTFGFGEKTGVDLSSEAIGLVPSPAWKKKILKQVWVGGDTLNMSIGQGAVSVTPIQAAVFLAAVANGGTLWSPWTVRRVEGAGRKILFQQTPKVRRRVVLDPRTWGLIHRAMEGVVQTGSGHVVFRPDLVIGAKTGTAQNPHGEDHAWFGAYAGKPGEPSSLVVVVLVENGGGGSSVAGPVVRDMIAAYFPGETR